MTVEIAKAAGATLVVKEELFRESDVVTSCASLLSSTNRMVGRDAASAIALASRSSFFCALT